MATIIDRAGPVEHSNAPSASVVSWGAIFAGTAVAIATTLILFALGSGLGFATASPWPGAGPSATSFAIGIGIWMIVMQWLSSALGGYITGRLRTRWVGLHTSEVFFRDTAHGLIAWAVATLLLVAVAMGATASAAGSASSVNTASYVADTMLRTNGSAPINNAVSAELARILGREDAPTQIDKAYVVQVVARQTGVSQSEATRRVDDAIVSLRTTADKMRKLSSTVSFFTALSMIIGAFIAAATAGYAGKLRDEAEDRLQSG